MANPVVKPEVPYNGKIPGGLVPGRMCRIQGVSHPEADRFDINFQTGPSSDPRDNTALHLSVRHNQGYIARNSYKDEEWGDEMGDGDLPIGHTEPWEILFLVDQDNYKIAINGRHFTEFPHRIPISQVNYLLIDGTVTITLISWEGIMGLGGAESASKASQVNSEGGPQFGGFAPPQGQGGYAPPQGQGGYFPPQGGYAPAPGYGAPAPGYGAPPQGYGPPLPPGAEPQQGGFDFMDTAQSLLSGAIKSGAAANILKGFMSSGSEPRGQGYAHQNAKYGIYPELPQDTNLNINPNNQPGPVEKLLSGLLSGGNNNQQAPGTNPQGQQNQQVDIGALLTNLLSSHQATQATQSHGAPQPNAPGTQQGGDIGTLLSSLLSGGKPGPQGQPGTQSAQGGPDLTNLLSGLLSGSATRPLQENTGSGAHQPSTGGTQSQGPDFGSLLSGLLSGGSHQNPAGPPGYQNPPGYPNPPGYQQPPGGAPGQQSQGGIDLGSLLSGLLSSTGGNQQPGGYQQPGGGYQQPGGFQQPGGYQPPRPGGGTRDVPPSNPPRNAPTRTQNAAKTDDDIVDVTDELEREMGRTAAGGVNRQRPQSDQGDEQYGYYPQPPQEQKGPLENLLSGLLSGGGGAAQQPHHPPQIGGGPSIGGLGSMSGLLDNFLHPRDQNPRQNY